MKLFFYFRKERSGRGNAPMATNERERERGVIFWWDKPKEREREREREKTRSPTTNRYNWLSNLNYHISSSSLSRK